jgi:hypothetical protein
MAAVRKVHLVKGSALLTLMAIAGACAPSSGGMAAPTTKVERVRIEGPNSNYDVSVTSETGETRSTLDFPAANVWKAVPIAYATMSIPTEGQDNAHRLFAGSVDARRTFNGNAVSLYVDCGSGLAGPNADAYGVRIRLQTQIDSLSASTSSVRTRVDATGTSTGGAVVRCSSTGALERQLANRIKLELVSPSAKP